MIIILDLQPPMVDKLTDVMNMDDQRCEYQSDEMEQLKKIIDQAIKYSKDNFNMVVMSSNNV